MAPEPTSAERRAAALEALKNAPPERGQAASFWERSGAKVVGAIALVLGLWLAVRAVGAFVRTSTSESDRAQEELRRGMRR